jgi:hypothetical protein
MLAEPIVVPVGDSFLQEPIDVNEAGVPHLPPLTWSQMSHLRREVELILDHGSDRPDERLQVKDRTLPELPPLDHAEMAHVKMRLERVLRDP